MHIVIAAPTLGEIEALVGHFPSLKPTGTHRWAGPWGSHKLELLATGVGMVNTAARLGPALATRPDFLLHIGIAGSYDLALVPGTAVEVVQECYGDMGAEDAHGHLLDMQQLGLPLMQQAGVQVYNELQNPHPASQGFPQVRGLTVNMVAGSEPTIEAREVRWDPDIESMEGAAVFQMALEAGVPFACLRGISNLVEPRNRDAWQLGAAIARVQEGALFYLQQRFGG